MCLQYKSLEKTAGKGEIARNDQFLLFPQCFLPVWRTFCHFHQIRNCHLPTLSVWKSLQFVILERINSLPNNKTLYWSKLKAFADNNLNVDQKLKLSLGRAENIVGKGENTVYQHFLLLSQCYQKAFFLESFKNHDCVVKS